MINQSLLCGGIFLDGIMITGGRPLSGSIRVQGSKNAALPVLAGTILHRGRTVIWNCPRITDVFWTVRILEELGCSVDFTGNRLEVDSTKAEGIRKEEVDHIRYLASGAEVPISTSWVHSDYPDIVFANLGPDPVLPDEVDTVLEVTLKE